MVVVALVLKCRVARPVKGDRSVQVVEKRERSVSDDPAVKGNFPPNGWLVAGAGTHLPTPPPEENEISDFAEMFGNTRAPRVVEEDLSPGSTRTVELQLTGPSGLAGATRWIGTADALKIVIALDGSTLATGTAYPMGTNRGGSYLHVRATGGGHATLSVTNTSGITVKVRILFMATTL